MYVPGIPYTLLRFVSSMRSKYLAHTINTNSKSSKISASCISIGTRSRLSALPFPLPITTAGLKETREFKGARTNDASSINEGSSKPALPTHWVNLRRNKNREQEGIPLNRLTRGAARVYSPSRTLAPSRYSLVFRTDAIVPATYTRRSGVW